MCARRIPAGRGHDHGHGLFQGVDHRKAGGARAGLSVARLGDGRAARRRRGLSPKAERLLAAYGDYCARMRAFAAEEFGRAFAEFAEEPQAESE